MTAPEAAAGLFQLAPCPERDGVQSRAGARTSLKRSGRVLGGGSTGQGWSWVCSTCMGMCACMHVSLCSKLDVCGTARSSLWDLGRPAASNPVALFLWVGLSANIRCVCSINRNVGYSGVYRVRLCTCEGTARSGWMERINYGKGWVE